MATLALAEATWRMNLCRLPLPSQRQAPKVSTNALEQYRRRVLGWADYE